LSKIKILCLIGKAADPLILLSALFSLAWTDYKFKLIPNKILVILMVIKTLFFIMDWPWILADQIAATTGFLVGGGIFLLCYLITGGKIGAGDVKLFAVLGYWTGQDRILVIIGYSMLVLAVFLVVMLAAGKIHLKTEMPIAPFVFVGTILAFVTAMFFGT